MRLKLLIPACILALLPLTVTASKVTTVWEEVSPAAVNNGLTYKGNYSQPLEEEGTAIFVNGGYIYVTTDHEVSVKIISILGHPISEGNLKPGTYRLKMNSRGIYIIKAGASTLRVTL